MPLSRGDLITDCLARWILDDEQQQFLGLNPWNIFFLGAAAHLFEIAAANPLDDLETKACLPDASPLSSASADIIKTHWDKLGIDNKEQARIIALICSLANDGSDDNDHLNLTGDVLYEGIPVNVSLLAKAICLAAKLDLEHPHTAHDIFADLAADNRISLDEISKSFHIESAGPHPFLSGTIQVKINCRHAEVHRALKHHECRIQRFLHLANSLVSPRFLFSEIIYEIEPDGYTPLDMKFSVDSTAALQLFTGNRLYSDRRVFLRELVQNAVDACNLKKLFDEAYTPEISIGFDDQVRIITFRDNGIGMDRQWIEKYFLKIGISFYQSGDLKNMNQHRVDFNFISKFGIGFLSSFLVSDSIVIKTRKNNAPGLVITITNLQDYFDVRFTPEDCQNGTEVTLHLSESSLNYCRSVEFIGYLKTNIRYLTIPVELIDHEGKSTILGREELEYGNDKKGGREVVVPMEFEDSKGYLFLKTKRNFDNLYALETAKGGISIFQDGIFVTQTDALLPEGARMSVVGRINLTGKDRCELSMDRNRIFWTEEQLQNIKRTIRIGIADLTNRIVVDAPHMDPPLNIEPSLINQLAIFFDFNEIDDAVYYRLSKPISKIVSKRFRNFIRVEFAHTRNMKGVPEADGYAEKWQQEILAAFAQKSKPKLPIS